MQKPSRKTMIVAGAASAGLIVLGGAVAVAQATGTPESGSVANPAANTNVAVDSTTSQAAPGTRISAEQAKRIALRTVPGSRVTDVDFDSADPNDEDVSDRVAQWEIDLVRGNTVYDVDIDANTGAVLKNRSEVDDDHGRGSDDRYSDDRGGSDQRNDNRGDDDGAAYDDHGRHHESEPGDDHGDHHRGGDDRHGDDDGGHHRHGGHGSDD